MRQLTWLLVGVAMAGGVVAAQEKKPPSDSELLSLPGCAKGRTFIVTEGPEHEPRQVTVAPGRRFRLEGPKDVLNDIKRREGQLIEVTGLVRKSDVAGPGGISAAGGRVQIGAGPPRASMGDPAREPGYNQAIMDVSAWRLLDGSCKQR
ncbi:MAG TPA: hypothetical protein VIY56_14830 [Vicinamibacterales bacterium]